MFKTISATLLMALLVTVVAVASTSFEQPDAAVMVEDATAEMGLIDAGSFGFVESVNCDLHCLATGSCPLDHWPPTWGECGSSTSRGCFCFPCNGVWGCHK